jgi:hypothetical protein
MIGWVFTFEDNTVNLDSSEYIYTYMYIYIYVYVYVFYHKNVSMYIPIHIYKYVYIYIYMNMIGWIFSYERNKLILNSAEQHVHIVLTGQNQVVGRGVDKRYINIRLFRY